MGWEGVGGFKLTRTWLRLLLSKLIKDVMSRMLVRQTKIS